MTPRVEVCQSKRIGYRCFGPLPASEIVRVPVNEVGWEIDADSAEPRSQGIVLDSHLPRGQGIGSMEPTGNSVASRSLTRRVPN